MASQNRQNYFIFNFCLLTTQFNDNIKRKSSIDQKSNRTANKHKSYARDSKPASYESTVLGIPSSP